MYLLSYRKQEPELPYLSYLLWWHEEPQARQEGPWWQLPLCGDKELWPGKEIKRILVKGWTVETDGNNPHRSYSPYTWTGSCCRYQQDIYLISNLSWIHQTPQDSEERHVPLARPGRTVPCLRSAPWLSPKSAKGDTTTHLHEDMIATTDMPLSVSIFQFNPI